MARSIEATLVLRGKTSRDFLKAAQNPKTCTHLPLDLCAIRKNVLALMDKEAVKKKGEDM